MELCNKKVVVVGTGVSGIGAVKLLAGTGAVIALYDGNEKADRNAIMAKLPENVEVELIIGGILRGCLNDAAESKALAFVSDLFSSLSNSLCPVSFKPFLKR